MSGRLPPLCCLHGFVDVPRGVRVLVNGVVDAPSAFRTRDGVHLMSMPRLTAPGGWVRLVLLPPVLERGRGVLVDGDLVTVEGVLDHIEVARTFVVVRRMWRADLDALAGPLLGGAA